MLSKKIKLAMISLKQNVYKFVAIFCVILSAFFTISAFFLICKMTTNSFLIPIGMTVSLSMIFFLLSIHLFKKDEMMNEIAYLFGLFHYIDSKKRIYTLKKIDVLNLFFKVDLELSKKKKPLFNSLYWRLSRSPKDSSIIIQNLFIDSCFDVFVNTTSKINHYNNVQQELINRAKLNEETTKMFDLTISELRSNNKIEINVPTNLTLNDNENLKQFFLKDYL